MSGEHTVSGLENLNAFPLLIQPGTTLAYRIWSVDPVPDSPELRERIRKDLRWRQLRRPIFPKYSDGTFTFAVADWGRREPVEFVGAGELKYTIAPTEDRRLIALECLGDADVDPAEAGLAAEMLQQELFLYLRDHPDLARGDRDDRFLINTPDAPYLNSSRLVGHPARRHHHARAELEIYRGFTFRVVPFSGVGLCVVLDVFTSYIGSETLAEYLSDGRSLPDGAQDGDGMGRWVHDYGRSKRTVYLLRTLDRSIGQVPLASGGTTYDYLCSKYPELRGRISTDDRAAVIVYRAADTGDETKRYTAAATLLKPKFSTESPQVRTSGDKPAFPPDERLRRITDALAYFQGARFAGQTVRFDSVLTQPVQVLPLPDLLFGPQERPTRLVASSEGADEQETRKHWGRRKTEALRRHGPYTVTQFNNPFLVYPAGLDDDPVLEQFIERTKSYCADYGKVEFDPRLSSYRDSASAQDIIDKVAGIVEHQQAGFILLALPPDPGRADRVYTAVKSRVRVPTKCFSTANLVDQAGRGPNRLASYSESNALAMLVENNARPWGLAEPLNYELQFGFDTTRFGHGGLMGVSVVGGVAASEVLFGYEEFDGREKVPAKIVGPFVREQLERFYQTNGRAPRSILFQRDGRLLGSERRGLRKALQRFADGHPGEPAPFWVAVSIEKNTAVRLRIFRPELGDVGRAYSGSYAVQNSRTGWLVLAGGPSLRQGTPRAVQVEIVDGNGDSELVPVLSDIFQLSQLNWSSPGIDISLPITLRFTDQKLERYALEPEVEDDDWEDQEE